MKNSEAFRNKLIKKEQWLKESFFEHYNKKLEPVLILLTDIRLPIINFDNEEVMYTNFTKLKNIIDNIFKIRDEKTVKYPNL